ncbi:hypothetical protein Hsero_2358 [Herbaspirillum seropedicae SmR1]|uniref:Uncharacterized protein n=1 Tax=Herbaspirillum seropedicae (strain SmR1) TaxID=757424 RepID=D8IVB8_HERSS|nr:hypothetical protein Hsero_2358 [Herbaspirillum seropedicae SmR1]
MQAVIEFLKSAQRLFEQRHRHLYAGFLQRRHLKFQASAHSGMQFQARAYHCDLSLMQAHAATGWLRKSAIAKQSFSMSDQRRAVSCRPAARQSSAWKWHQPALSFRAAMHCACCCPDRVKVSVTMAYPLVTSRAARMVAEHRRPKPTAHIAIFWSLAAMVIPPSGRI